jgi:selenocysteine lyase/cysteine desulfurase
MSRIFAIIIIVLSAVFFFIPLLLRLFRRKVIKFDNAATTEPIPEVSQYIRDNLMENYGSVGRGSGPCSEHTTELKENAIQYLKEFFKADLILFTSNTSDSINRLAEIFHGKNILISPLEHTSNIQPWITHGCSVTEIKYSAETGIDFNDLEFRLSRGEYTIISITGMSNVTGIMVDINRVYDLANRHGVLLHIDMAQALPSYYIKTGFENVNYHFLSFSSHKIYSSEYQCGCLVIKSNETVKGISPPHTGGGQVYFSVPYTPNEGNASNLTIYKSPAIEQNPGTWNVPAIVALAETIAWLRSRDLDKMFETKHNVIKIIHNELSRYSNETDKIRTEIITTPDSSMLTFRVFVDGIREPPRKISKFFGLHNIETRAGCFCAYNYVANYLLHLSTACINNYIELVSNGTNTEISARLLDSPIGYIRLSPGLFCTERDAYMFVDTWRKWLETIK